MALTLQWSRSLFLPEDLGSWCKHPHAMISVLHHIDESFYSVSYVGNTDSLTERLWQVIFLEFKEMTVFQIIVYLHPI